MIKLVLVVSAVSGLVFALSCDNSFFLRGTIGGDCDPPRTIIATMGGSDVATLRKSNCQAMGATCCRRSSQIGRTTCQYPEDCYVAPYQGACGTPVDCADTQTCTAGSCQCVDTGPPCENPTTHVVTCCAVGLTCNAGMCGMPLDGGT